MFIIYVYIIDTNLLLLIGFYIHIPVSSLLEHNMVSGVTDFPEEKCYKNDIPFEKWFLDFEEYIFRGGGATLSGKDDMPLRVWAYIMYC